MNVNGSRHRLIEAVREVIAEAPNHITGNETLTADLGMGSLDLMRLFAVIDAKIGAVDLLPWLVASTIGGRDTVDGLCGYVAAALEADNPTRSQP